MMATTWPGNNSYSLMPPPAQSSRNLLINDCWQVIRDHLTARDVVQLSQVDRNLNSLFPLKRALVTRLVERYYGTDDKTQCEWRTILGNTSHSDYPDAFKSWQGRYFPSEEDQTWLRLDLLRLRALFRYLSNGTRRYLLQPEFSLRKPDIICMAPLPDGRLVFSTKTQAGSLSILNLDRPDCEQSIATLSSHSSWVRGIKVLKDKRLVTYSADNTLKVWDLSRPGQDPCVATLTGHTDHVTCVAALPNSRLVSGSHDSTLKAWDLSLPEERQCIATRYCTSVPLCMDTLPDGRLAVGHLDGSLELYAPPGLILHSPSRSILNPLEECNCLVALPNNLLISGSRTHLTYWDISKPPGKERTAFDHTDDRILSIDLLFDGRLVTNTAEHGMDIWDPGRPNLSAYIIHLPLPNATRWPQPIIHLNNRLVSRDQTGIKIWHLKDFISSYSALPLQSTADSHASSRKRTRHDGLESGNLKSDNKRAKQVD